MKEIKIAFATESGGGKDYLVEYIMKKYGFSRLSFSDQLKKFCVEIYPWMKRDYPPLVKEQPLNITTEFGEFITATPREMWLSIDTLRAKDKFVFIRRFAKELELTKVPRIAVSDIRTKEELDLCISKGFTIVYIDPIKQIYKPNDFDDFARSVKAVADLIFCNEFNGTDNIDIFMKQYFLELDE